MSARIKRIEALKAEMVKHEALLRDSSRSQEQNLESEIVVGRNGTLIYCYESISDEQYDKEHTGTIKTVYDMVEWLGIKVGRPFLMNGELVVVYFDESEQMLLIDGDPSFPHGMDIYTLIGSRIAPAENVTLEQAEGKFDFAMKQKSSRAVITAYLTK